FLAQGLAVAACRHKLTARYFRLADLADEFDATADAAYERKALGPDPLMVDTLKPAFRWGSEVPFHHATQDLHRAVQA
ncbi:hypothetical protein ACL1IT_14315, partial [Corynebacterium striatum]